MANPSTSSSGLPSSYRSMPGRNVTKRWKEANTVDYENDGWGDDGYGDPALQMAQDQRSQGWGPSSAQQAYEIPPGQYYPSDRTATMRSTGTGRSWDHSSAGRPSFDQGDERRNFAGVGGSQEGPYPTTGRQDFPDIQHDDNFQQPMRGLRGPPPLHVQTGARPSSRERGPYSAPYYGPDPRMNQYPDPRAGPFSAAIAHSGGRRSGSSSRPSHGEIFGRHESPARPGSRGSQASNSARQQLPPRKSSLSQQKPPPEIYSTPVEPEIAAAAPSQPTGEVKALPFLRPIDIWKRHEEEMSEQRSQASSRPSMESSASKDPTGSVLGNARDAVPIVSEASQAAEESQPARSALDPVQERRSEHGLESITAQAAPQHSAAMPASTSPEKEPEPASATSEYSNRLDPVTTASLYSQPSVRERHDYPQRQESVHSATTVEPTALPPVGMTSGFGTDFPSGTSVSDQTEETNIAPPIPTKDAPAVPTESVPPFASSNATNLATSAAPQTALQHNTSHGYRSMVEQAFDESQREPPTPISAADTMPRSNSASTFDISPIVSRNAGQQMPPMPNSQPAIPEETNDQYLTGSQLRGQEPVSEQPPPVPFKPGYRRDTGTPSPDNSPARKPTNTTASEVPQAALATTSYAMPASTANYNNHAALAPNPTLSVDNSHLQEDRVSRFEKPLPSVDQTSPGARSASSEYRDWQAQRKQFNTKMGIQTDSPSTPGIPSPISRTESPSKGTVRDIAGRLESNSGQSSPVTTDAGRPTQNRFESFRPSIPGGWQSYSTNTPQQESRSISPEPTSLARPEMPYRTETTESQIPRAGPPQRDNQENTSKSAFAAAAAAGSALAGAFGGHGPSRTKNAQRYSHEQSDDDDESTQHVSRGELNASETRDFAAATPTNPTLERTASPVPPPPLPKDTPRLSDEPPATSAYLPAPLKTKRSNETRTPIRPPIPEGLAHDVSPNEENNERLHQEIEQSLTPRSSHYGPGLADEVRGHPTARKEENLAASAGESPAESNLPREYDPYWKTSHNPGHNSGERDVSREPSVKQEREENVGNPPQPGFLDQRFSWETGQNAPDDNREAPPPSIDDVTTPAANRSSDVDAGSPETIRASDRAKSPVSDEGSRSKLLAGTSAAVAGFAAVPLAASAMQGHSDHYSSVPGNGSSSDALRSPTRDALGLNPSSALNPTGPTPSSMANAEVAPPVLPKSDTREIPFRNILGMENPQDKMKAYSANREHFGTSDGGLERWLQSMGQQSPENANIVASNGTLSRDQIEALQSYRPSPAKASISRLTSGTFASPSASGSGTKQIQQDGKRLVSAAGKFSKGLLAKGKDKLRTASASDKGNRRRSSGPVPGPIPEESTQHSTNTGPPQIPEQDLNISPVDRDSWSLPFGNYESENATGKARDVNTPSQLRNYSSSSIPTNQSSRLAPTTLPGTSSALVPAPSPKVSIISHNENRDVPSRSISEVTKSGEERSPVGRTSEEHERHSRGPLTGGDALAAGAVGLAAAGATAAAVAERKEDSVTSSDVPTPHAVDSKSLNTPSMTAVHMNDPSMKTHQGDSSSAIDNSNLAPTENMADPRSNRYSAVSNMSNSEQVPGRQEESSRGMPSGLNSHPPDTGASMSEEQQMNAVDRPPERFQSLRKSGSSPQKSGASRIGPNAEILPVADLSSRRREEDQSTQPRPFSFAASNALMEPVNQNAAVLPSRETPTKASAPTGEPLNKELSNVSVDEVPDESRNPGNRISKSYSRPFGGDPNVGDHPAFRSSPLPMDRSQMYSSESPLPSARRESPLPSANRPPEDFNRYRQESAPKPREDEQYRIPGPYVQEYRSPKQQPQGFAQRQWPTNQQQLYGQPNQPINQQQQYGQMSPPPNQQQQYGQTGPPQIQQQYRQSGPGQQPAMAPPEKPKHRTIGGLFGNRSKSRSRSSRQDSFNEPEKRNSLFKTKSRQDSVGSSQRSQSLRESESRDQVSQLPHWAADGVNGSRSRLSKEIPRSSTMGSTLEEPAKKKRHSGLGSLFSRGSKSGPQRSSTTQAIGGRPSKLGASQQDMYNQQVASVQQRNGAPGRQSPENFRGNMPPPSGYYGPPEQYENRSRAQQQQHPASAFPHGPDSVGGQYPPGQQARFSQGDSRSQSYQSNTMPYQQPPDQRPSNLRIDTGEGSEAGLAGSRGQYPTNVPSTAPPGAAPNTYHPQSTANPAIYSYDSFQGRAQQPYTQPQSQPQTAFPGHFTDQAESHAPTSQPSYTTTTAPLATGVGAAAASATHSHVAELHKRSRSPRHGRQPSDDDDYLAAARQVQSDPAAQLGTFKNRSPAGGVPQAGSEQEGQEKPWRIDLPEAEEREREAKRRSKQMLIERGGTASGATSATTAPGESAGGIGAATRSPTSPQQGQGRTLGEGAAANRPLTVAEKMLGQQPERAAVPPLAPASAASVNRDRERERGADRDREAGRGGAATGAAGKEFAVAELPGSKAEGYESDEEIPMSATAYPGQEWMPYGAQELGYGRWDD